MAMMVPGVATMIPLFKMMSKFGFLNTVWGFMLPGISTPFLIMMFRQNSRNFPIDIMEAARIDGLSEVPDFLLDASAGHESDLCGSGCYHIHECVERISLAKSHYDR